MPQYYAGVMSGTSLDGADAVIVEFETRTARTIAMASEPFSASLRERLLELCAPGNDGLDDAGELSVVLADHYAAAVRAALSLAAVDPKCVLAIGCHGQTVRHRPERGFSVQLNNPARLAELTGIDVVADFRSRDIAAGGQGAPLVPAFHDAVFRDPAISRAIVNIGGIANVTLLPASGIATGFDCGPGNILLDAWTDRHRGTAFDSDGEWAAGGSVVRELLDRCLAEAYFASAPPKSTGRELFNPAWLEARLAPGIAPRDVQATLLELSAVAISQAILSHGPEVREVYLCGGGARNGQLRKRIMALVGNRTVALTDALGIPTGQVEAAAFAWLAMKCVRREAVSLERSTGARGPRILGAVYPA